MAKKNAKEVISYLNEREMVNRVYRPKWLPVALPKGKIMAYAFIVDRGHEQYTGRLADAEALKLIGQGAGKGGACLDYLQNTIRHLDELGIPDGPRHRLVKMAEETAEPR